MTKTIAPLAVLAASAFASWQARPADPAPFRLGVVNLKTCFEADKHERIKEVDAELGKRRGELAKRLQEIRSRVERLQVEIEQLPRESALRAEKILDARRAQSELKTEEEIGRAQYLNFFNDKRIEIYNRIRQAVDAVARTEKLDLVLRVEAPLLEDQDTPNVSAQVNNRAVLFHQEQTEITPLVLKHLNEEYVREKTGREK